MANLINTADNYSVSNRGVGLDENSRPVVNEKSAVSSFLGDDFTPEILLKTALLMPPLLLADKFVNSQIAGEENKSLLKKITNFGDSIAKKLHLENFSGEKAGNFIKNNRITKYFTSDYSAVPRFSQIKFDPIAIKYSKELIEQLKKIKENPEFEKKLSQETKDFISNLDKEKPPKDTKKLIQEAEKLIKDGVTTPENTSKLSELRNKLKAASLQMGETKFGSLFAKYFLIVKKTFTFGGGIPGFAFASLNLNQSYKAATDAPEGEKFSTFMHLFSEHFIGFLLFEPGINLLYQIGGNKYRGMTLDNRQALEELVSSTNSNENLTKDGLKLAEKKRDLLLKGFDKSEVLGITSIKEADKMLKQKSKLDLKFWEKPLRFFGRFISMGLDKMQMPNFVNLPIIGRKNITRPTFKGTLGGALRFAGVMFVIQPILQKPVTALTHAIFGRPEAYLAKEKGENAENETEEVINKIEEKPVQQVKINSKTHFLNKLSNNSNNAPVKNDKIKTSSTLTERQKRESRLYVPSIQVDNSYLTDKENELNEEISPLLQNSDMKINSLYQTLQY